ncbi:amidase [Actibacterium sp. 188UL27-1]|uniref:amidase n=1 Tax=Actibacterium sp. 188UL27-1 TaxID=2786961 RepID=UPI0019571F31|nr:amidase family protein [Actibacterium sp. 188UL27-1]MBM7065973.1 amidase [Actibacterium sp. 188UL27-1]
MNKWLSTGAVELGRAIGTGEVDPVDLTEVFLSTIAEHPHRDRIYARLTPDRARAEARAASQRAKLKLRRSILDGVPISWKDLFDTAGTVTEAGTALLRDRSPNRDATVLEMATGAGLVCLGKTHMTELAFSGLGLNPVTASPPCVNDVDAVSGGSSSGAATSVAFGLAAAGIGSDTGGSVRIPSAWNDLVGLKTSTGLLPLTGVVPLCARFDTVGPLCRNVEDAAHLLAAMSGTAAPDLHQTSLTGAKLLALQNVALDDIRDQPHVGYKSAVERLQAAGAEVDRRDIPLVSDAMALSSTLFAPEAYGTWGHLIAAKPDLMFKEVRERFETGKSVSAPDFVAGWQKLEGLRVRFWAEVAGYDAVILPTSPIMPPNMQRLTDDSDYFVAENLLALRNTRIGNLMDAAALTLPTGVPSTGITLMTPRETELRLLRLGMAAEEALS